LARRRGIFTTADGGKPWLKAVADTGQRRFESVRLDPLDPLDVERRGFDRTGHVSFLGLATDPTNPALIYTGRYSSPFFVRDGGLLERTDSDGIFAGTPLDVSSTITAVAVDPVDSNTVYLAGYVRLSPTSFAPKRLLRSTDGGRTFVAADTGLSGGVIGVGIDPQDPSRLFACTGAGVFTSGDRGATWTLLKPETTARERPFGVLKRR
jgi:hypothetical protein